MIRFPHAKINLGLSVVSRRPDGFHDIESIFYPIPLRDALEILPGSTNSLDLSGLPVPGIPEDNLLIRAWNKLKEECPALPSLQIILHKAIPMGAGLGGGSSDAAALLLMMNSLFRLNLPLETLSTIAAALGSDCPFFLQSGACLGTGKGETLEPVAVDLSGFDLLLIHPTVSISTAWAYGQIRPAAPAVPLKTLIPLSPEKWKGLMINAFETPVFAAFPSLAFIKASLYEAGALYAAMTGSGSTIFGIFERGTAPDLAETANQKSHLLKASST